MLIIVKSVQQGTFNTEIDPSATVSCLINYMIIILNCLLNYLFTFLSFLKIKELKQTIERENGSDFAADHHELTYNGIS